MENEQGNLVENEQGNLMENEQGNLMENEQGNLMENEQGNLMENEQGNLMENDYSIVTCKKSWYWIQKPPAKILYLSTIWETVNKDSIQNV